MNNEKTVINKHTVMNPELCQKNNILMNIVSNYMRRCKYYWILRKWKLVFYNDIFFDVKSLVLYRTSVLRENLEKYFKKKQISLYKRQGLVFSHISEINISFVTSVNHMTYKHFIEQPMPMVERLIKETVYKLWHFKNLRGVWFDFTHGRSWNWKSRHILQK